MSEPPARSGAPWLDTLGAAVAAGKSEDPMAPVTVVVPTNIAGIVARRHLARGLSRDTNGIAGIWFTTVPRLAERIAAPLLHAAGRRPAGAAIIAATTLSLLRAEPGIFGPIADHPATVQAIARAHRELSEVDDDALNSISAVSTLTADVVRVHRELRTRLARDWYESSDLLSVATACIDRAEFPVDELGVVIDYLPRDRTPLESLFVEALCTVRPMQTVSAPMDFATCNPPVYADRIITASDSDDEVRTVVREVIEELKTTPAHQVAVLYTDRTPYARLLHEQLTAATIVINGAGARPVIERGVPQLALSLLEAARTGWQRANLMRALSAAPVTGFDGERVPSAKWERVSREAGVVEGEWSSRLGTFADNARRRAAETDSDSRRDAAERTALAADKLAAFVSTLQQRAEAINSSTSWSACSQALAALVESLLPQHARQRMPLEEQYAAEALDRSIAGLTALDGSGVEASLAAAEDAILLDLEHTLPRVGRFGEGVFVGSLAEAAGLSLARIFVVGLSEDLCPGHLREDSLLPERVRSQSLGQLRPTKDRVARTEMYLVSAFLCAPKVTASFARGDLRRQTARLPSRWLMPTFRLRSGTPTLAATNYATVTGDWLANSPSYAGGIASMVNPATEQEWRLRALQAGMRVEGGALDAHRATVAGRSGEEFSAYDGNLAGAKGLPAFANGERSLSASSLESYAKCPHAWFVQKLLDVQPIEESANNLEIAASVVGTIVHNSFDRWVRECVASEQLPSYGQPWTTAQAERLQEIGRDVGQEFERAGQTGHPRIWGVRRRQILAALGDLVEQDNTWRAERNARVLGSEIEFGMTDDPNRVVVQTHLGDVRMRGSIDKVDQTRDGTLIVTDIKTGSAGDFEKLSEANPVMQGTKLQLPLYAHAARQHFGQPTADVEAHYLFVLRTSKRITLPLTQDVEAIYRAAIGTLVDSVAAWAFPATRPGVSGLSMGAMRLLQSGRDRPRRAPQTLGTRPRLRRTGQFGRTAGTRGLSRTERKDREKKRDAPWLRKQSPSTLDTDASSNMTSTQRSLSRRERARARPLPWSVASSNS